MIRAMGNVESFELCETIPKVRMPSLLESRNSLLHLWTSLWLKANPANIFTNGDGMLSQSRTTSSKRSDLVVFGTAKLRHRNSISWPTMLERDVSKRNFEEIHDRFQRYSSYRDS